jgi:hypothetical protein
VKADEKKCPKCAEAVKIEATVCKHCQHVFSAEEIARAKKQQEQGQIAGGIGCAIVGALILAYCTFSGGSDPKEEAKQAATSAEDRRKGFHCLSAWDGSNRSFVAQVKAQLRDPGSFEHSDTRITPATAGKHNIIMEYRAKNGFGGMNVETVIGTVDPATCEATIVTSPELEALR